MSHLCNPLATINQVYERVTYNVLSAELQDSIRFYTARLTQAAGILLRLPQDITAQANVLLFRYWLIDDMMTHEFSEVSAATIYLTAKISSSPRSLRSIANVYAYLLSSASALSNPHQQTTKAPDHESYYLSESTYFAQRTRILHLEGQILYALGFNTHVALPHSLTITYLQTLGVFEGERGKRVALDAIALLNSALLSPQMLFLTHQPYELATAAIYLACRRVRVKLPDVEWWLVFDCEREVLGFLVLAMRCLEPIVAREVARWGAGVGMLARRDVLNLRADDVATPVARNRQNVVDEESEMAILLDAKVDSMA